MLDKNNRTCPQCGIKPVGPHSHSGLCRGCAISNVWASKRGGNISEPNPSGLCMCGCRKKTHLARQSQAATGTVKGKPQRFLPNHHNNLSTVPKRVPFSDPDDATTYIVPLTRGEFAYIDTSDAERVSSHSWGVTYAFGLSYARTSVSGRQVMLHRFIMGDPAGVDIDHVDGNGLNNRRGNLRVASHIQNMANRGAARNNTSGYRGVSPVEGGRFRARIMVNGHRVSLGVFDSPEEAARIVDAHLSKEAGVFARLNFPDDEDRSD